MNLKKKMLVLGLAVLATVSLTACGSGADSGKVSFLNWKDGDGFTDQIRDSFVAQSKAAGFEVEVVDGKGDANMQVDQLKAAIEEKPAAIVLLAVDGTSIIPTVEKANAAGIPIFITNRGLNGGQYYSVMADDKEAGRMQGEYMAKNLPQGAKIVYLEGEAGNVGSQARWEGFKEACLDKRPDIVLLSKSVSNWSMAVALRTTTLWLKLFPQIDGVVAANDNMAMGAIQALKDAGRLQGCLVSGVDATDDALKAIKAGEMAQTVKQDANGLAEGLATLVGASIKGQNVANMTISFTPITKDNVAQFAK